MIAIIAAVAKNNVIGKANDLPWYLPEDLKRFKKLTTGHTVIMGRNTYESILKRLGKPLPDRKNVVITSDPNYPVMEKFRDLSDAIAQQTEDVFLIGGQRIFEQGLAFADTLYLTELHQDYEGNIFFPQFDKSQWRREVEEQHPEFDFVKYERIN